MQQPESNWNLNVEPENKIDIARLNFIAVKTEFV